jgi:hypothetical protein
MQHAAGLGYRELSAYAGGDDVVAGGQRARSVLAELADAADGHDHQPAGQQPTMRGPAQVELGSDCLGAALDPGEQQHQRGHR